MTVKLSVIGIVTSDMAASLAFYRRLGLDVPASADGESHVGYELPGGLQVMWDTVEVIRSFEADFEPPASSGVSLAFACADPAEVDATYAELVGAGHASGLEPWDAAWGQRYATVTDPDGYVVSLFAPLKS